MKLDSSFITEFIEYMWKWPLIEGSDEFDPWVSSSPELVDFALGNNLPLDLKVFLEARCVEEQKFRNIAEGLVEIIWGSC